MRKKGSNNKKNFSVRMHQETIDAIEELAKMRRRTKTDLIRIIVENYVRDWQETKLFAKDNFCENVTQVNEKKLIKIKYGN